MWEMYSYDGTLEGVDSSSGGLPPGLGMPTLSETMQLREVAFCEQPPRSFWAIAQPIVKGAPLTVPPGWILDEPATRRMFHKLEPLYDGCDNGKIRRVIVAPAV